jgi:glycosyltransferase involved in cell wall biosynthesis
VGISPHVAAHLPGVDRVIPCMLPGQPDPVASEKSAAPSLIYLGSRRSRKRGEVALEVYETLKKTHPDLELNYVGPEREIEELKSRGAYPDVRFLTKLSHDQLAALYRQSWIYLCLSSYEGFGVGIIEAMSFSCLVVTAPHPGSEYLVRDGDTGIVAPPESAAAMVGRILGDEPSRREMVRRAREFSRKFSPATVASSYLDLYRMAQARTTGASA